MKNTLIQSSSKLAIACAAGLFSATLMTGVAQAQSREYSANVALTTDYVFRGITQTDGHPAIQGGFDVTVGQFYAGTWASNLDFGSDGRGNDVADIEIDLYAGLKRKFIDRVETDLGVIYYHYPDASSPAGTGELDYFELKLGNTLEVNQNLSLNAVVYYSPDYTGEIGEAWTYEGGGSLKLRSDITLSALVGTTQFVNGAQEDYTYWNAGITYDLSDKFSLDARYHGSDCGFQLNGNDVCGDRFVGTLKASF